MVVQRSILMASGKKIEFADTGEYISGDTNDLTIASGRHIVLSSTSNVGINNSAPNMTLEIGNITGTHNGYGLGVKSPGQYGIIVEPNDTANFNVLMQDMIMVHGIIKFQLVILI